MLRYLLTLMLLTPALAGERLSLDAGWRFHLGDIERTDALSHEAAYSNAKAGTAWGPAGGSGYDDSEWRVLSVPHDFVVEGPFEQGANLSQGYRPRGVAWYRRHFALPESDRGKHLEVQLDGVATHSTVWFNGQVVSRNFNGYTSQYLDVTQLARFGDDEVNTLAVRVDASPMEGWWYEGGGVYRHAWLVKRAPVHLVTDGVWANPVKVDGKWTVPVEATLGSCDVGEANVTVEATLLDADGKELAQATADATVRPFEERVAKLALDAPADPKLWSPDSPTLYAVRTRVLRDGNEVDSETTRVGFRTLRFDADAGFFLNDQPLKLKGTCNHQDHAGVGVALPDAIWRFRVEKLKAMGSNAYRTSHNPPSRELLDLCDELGLLVMDETRHFNAAPDYLRQLEWLVRRDRSHPSVFMWSVLNEEPLQGAEQGYELARKMVATVKRLDPTRPTTAAMNHSLFAEKNAGQAVDVVGINYQTHTYDEFKRRYPTKPVTSSEDTSGFITRGAWVTNEEQHVKDGYDTHAARWGATHRAGWKAIAGRPFLAGGFVWTGFDYRGEPTPYEWPSAGSFFGIMDLCGFPKSAFYMHQAHWSAGPVLKLVPHWNGRDGETVKVMPITNADTVKLTLNGEPAGEVKIDAFDFGTVDVPWRAGRLEAVAYKDGVEVARDAIETTGEAVALQLVVERSELSADGADALAVTVQAIDAEGRTVPTANVKARFAADGPAAIIGLGNGDPNSHEPEQGGERSLFNGLAQLIVRAGQATGEARVTASAEGLKSAMLTLKLVASDRLEIAPLEPVVSVERWRMSPTTDARPDANVELAGNDQNTWPVVQAGRTQRFEGGRFAVLRTRFTPRATERKNGGSLVLSGVVGKAEVWVDGKLLAKKDDAAPGEVRAALPAAEGERVVSVLIEAEAAGAQAGLGGPVKIEAR